MSKVPSDSKIKKYVSGSVDDQIDRLENAMTALPGLVDGFVKDVKDLGVRAIFLGMNGTNANLHLLLDAEGFADQRRIGENVDSLQESYEAGKIMSKLHYIGNISLDHYESTQVAVDANKVRVAGGNFEPDYARIYP